MLRAIKVNNDFFRKLKTELADKVATLKLAEIDYLEPQKQLVVTTQKQQEEAKVQSSNNWKDIHPDFTDKLVQK